MKVYIVEESHYDHHDNIACFSSKEKAENFCHKHYTQNKDIESWWRSLAGYDYSIHEYDVDADSV